MLSRKRAGILLAVLIAAAAFSPSVRALAEFPDYIAITEGEQTQLDFGLPLALHLRADRSDAVSINGSILGSRWEVFPNSSWDIEPLQPGELSVETRLLGIIPFRKVTVDVIPAVELMPGGQSIGIILRTDGVMIVGHAPVKDERGRVYYPGREAGLETGDVITEIDGRRVAGPEQVAAAVDAAGGEKRRLDVVVRRAGELKRLTLKPVYNPEEGRHLLGLWIRDSTAGMGTLTFYHPGAGTYGALGHIIVDADTRMPVEVDEGSIVGAAVTAIEKGRQGEPGKKVGRFRTNGPALGDIHQNSDYGIFGSLSSSLEHPLFDKPLRMSLASEVREGDAEIVTVVDGEEMDRFQVKIERIMSRQPGGKNMVVRITDPRLLEASGGIVQGMSGSPIIQDGQLAGAVTHVFVNDPTRGYGVLAQWMVASSGLLEELSPGRGWPEYFPDAS